MASWAKSLLNEISKIERVPTAMQAEKSRNETISLGKLVSAIGVRDKTRYPEGDCKLDYVSSVRIFF